MKRRSPWYCLILLILMMTAVPVSAANVKDVSGSEGQKEYGNIDIYDPQYPYRDWPVTSATAQVIFYNSRAPKNSIEYPYIVQNVDKGTYLTLAKLPKVKGYQAKGWTTVKNGKTAKYKENSRLKVTRDLKLYAVYKKEPVAILHGRTGSVWKKATAVNGRRKLPSLKNTKNSTFLGWSPKPGQTTNPKYKAGEVITLKKDMHLYPVIFDRSKEPDIKAANMNRLDTRKYKKVIFVGDSRTYYMEHVLKSQFDDKVTKNVSFISLSGIGLDWLKWSGVPELMEELQASSTQGKPVAVIFNMGVNDLKHNDGENLDVNSVISNYVSYMKEIAPILKAQNCKLFYMSVNPINSSMLKTKGQRKEEDIQAFNQGIRTGLKGSYRYLDAYSYLYKNGFGTENAKRPGADDGIHYTSKTYKRIYRYCIKQINRL